VHYYYRRSTCGLSMIRVRQASPPVSQKRIYNVYKLYAQLFRAPFLTLRDFTSYGFYEAGAQVIYVPEVLVEPQAVADRWAMEVILDPSRTIVA
jgi:hypothetical protein